MSGFGKSGHNCKNNIVMYNYVYLLLLLIAEYTSEVLKVTLCSVFVGICTTVRQSFYLIFIM